MYLYAQSPHQYHLQPLPPKFYLHTRAPNFQAPSQVEFQTVAKLQANSLFYQNFYELKVFQLRYKHSGIEFLHL